MEINSNDYPVKKKKTHTHTHTISFHLHSPLIGREVIPELRMNGYCLKLINHDTEVYYVI